MGKLLPDHLNLSRLDYEGLQTLVGWARDEGWNMKLQDPEVFCMADFSLIHA